MRTLFVAAALAAALALTQAAAAQVVHGRVVDAGTGAPVRAAVWLRELGLPDVGPVRADSAGEFTLRAPRPGMFRLAAGGVGYRETESLAFELEADDSIEVVFRLSPGAVLLDPLEVVASARRRPGWLEDFRRRAERGAFGWFATRAEIERLRPVRTTELLRAVPGIRLVPGRGAGYAVRGRGGCVPAVYLDGVRLPGGAGSIDLWTSPSSLEGIEVYHGTAVPAEFSRPGSACGAVLLWSRMGG